MARFLLGRLVALVVTLFVASFVIFGSLYLAPGTPLTFLTHGRSMPQSEIDALKHEYHLDQPFLQQYWSWLSGVLHGNFGKSIVYKQNVLDLVGARAPNTIYLVCCAAILILLLGLCVGIIAGLKPGWLDSALMLAASTAMAVPVFVSAIVLVTLFAVNNEWFPVLARATDSATGSITWCCRASRSRWAVSPTSPGCPAPPYAPS